MKEIFNVSRFQRWRNTRRNHVVDMIEGTSHLILVRRIVRKNMQGKDLGQGHLLGGNIGQGLGKEGQGHQWEGPVQETDTLKTNIEKETDVIDE